jgi:hypothetical protein
MPLIICSNSRAKVSFASSPAAPSASSLRNCSPSVPTDPPEVPRGGGPERGVAPCLSPRLSSAVRIRLATPPVLDPFSMTIAKRSRPTQARPVSEGGLRDTSRGRPLPPVRERRASFGSDSPWAMSLFWMFTPAIDRGLPRDQHLWPAYRTTGAFLSGGCRDRSPSFCLRSGHGPVGRIRCPYR